MNTNTAIVRRPIHGEQAVLADALLDRIVRGRGINHASEIEYKFGNMLAPTLSGLDKACARLYSALQQQQQIVIVGDFDADGATSTALLLKMLPRMGFRKLNYIVPNRFDYGYGLSVGILEQAHKLFAPELIITVDNGISSVEGAARAAQLGIDLIITDHHLPPAELPIAAAIVNPNLSGDQFPSKNLAGVGVSFYLLIALRALLREHNYFQAHQLAEPDLREGLDLVALGTVADVVPLDSNNRILVAQGLKLIQSGAGCAGIAALFKVANRDINFASAQDLSFAVAPRLNAAGRLEDISIGIECLMSDVGTAATLAQTLDDINCERREIEAQMKATAFVQLGELEQRLNQEQQQLPAGICLYQPDWHQGVVGILAARIKERYQRPCIIFAAEDANYIKGSARSISSVHIRDVLANIDAQHPQLIAKFGGHAMAAGLSIRKQNFAQFAQLFAQQIANIHNANIGARVITTDGELDSSELTLLTADKLAKLAPYGQGFAAPLFDGVFELCNRRLLKAAHLKVELRQGDKIFDGIAFNETGEMLPERESLLVEVVYALDINRYNNRQSLQLIIELIRPYQR